ncbi:unnamed protein product [Urochloa decumbens]|uniref:NAC domain-containing protein n=1 Tax=Urochloa decumbens TaxID=240449 RepID=A0ABC9C862_9POAL
MANSWIMTGMGLVKKIRNATQSISLRLGELVVEPYIKCPHCECGIDTSNVSLVWAALPAGVKFDPSDLELLQHLQGKSGLLNSNSRAVIDEFIPTIENMEGICYTHPQNLPGAKMDGSSIHFFHRVSNAYGCGKRKRRKISGDDDVSDEHIRWHKTGDSKVICDENGSKIGWKKILVLYSGSKRGGGGKIDRNNWVMHQYHLGSDENEKNGEFVVSKIFYQMPSKKNSKSETCDVVLESDAQIDPKTLKADPHQPLHPNNGSCVTEQHTPLQVDQGGENCGTSIYRVKEEGAGSPARFDGTQAAMDTDLPASDERVQSRDPPDPALDKLYDELPKLDPPCLGAPSGLSISLADMPLGSPDGLWGWTWPDIC